MNDTNLPEHVAANREYWDNNAHEWVSAGERSWQQLEPTWGIWALPESELQLLPRDMAGMRTIELGCGTGYVSGWMMRRGATAVGIDNSAEQLKTAEKLMNEHRMPFELIHGNAEVVPYPDASFDFAISEYGAAIWADPVKWIPEAHRLLKPGGELVFLGSHPLAIITTPPNGEPSEPHLHRNYFELYRQDWREVEVDPGGMEFNLPISSWLKLFRETGFEVLDYLELQAPDHVDETQFSSPANWSKQWPSEQVWKLRKT
jgi:ubiquinone/menaquinone biosynthesis C-methylase UbiE